MKKHVLLLVSNCAFTISVFSQTTLALQPDPTAGKDAEVFSCVPCGYDVRNFGTKRDLDAIAWTNAGNFGITRSLFQFNLTSIPTNSVIVSAYLNLYFNPASTEGTHSGVNASYLQKITDPWSETTVTWNNQPTTTTANQISLATSSTTTQDYININVKNLIVGMVQNPSTNYGFMLKLQNETAYRKLIFASSDHLTPTLRPQLVITYTSPLPVELMYFNATSGKDEINLKWATASETNNSGFEIERSESLSGSFSTIGFVSGNGTTSAVHNYQFVDHDVTGNILYYYRLKQINFDGIFTHSHISTASVERKEILLNANPNPFNETTTLSYYLDENRPIQFEIFNQTGTLVYSFSKAESEGWHSFDFSPSDAGFCSGIFQIRLIAGNSVMSKRVIAAGCR